MYNGTGILHRPPFDFARLMHAHLLASRPSRALLRARRSRENEEHESSPCRFARTTFGRENVGARAQKGAPVLCKFMRAQSRPLRPSPFLYADDDDDENNPFGYWVIGYTAALFLLSRAVNRTPKLELAPRHRSSGFRVCSVPLLKFKFDQREHWPIASIGI